MNTSYNKPIILYTSSWCAQAISVEGFLDRNEIPVQKIKIDKDPAAREKLIEINGGYASVPTLIFPDGTKLTEPSLAQLQKKLALKSPSSLTERVRALLRQKEQTEGT